MNASQRQKTIKNDLQNIESDVVSIQLLNTTIKIEIRNLQTVVKSEFLLKGF
jgi:hypothetical protein